MHKAFPGFGTPPRGSAALPSPPSWVSFFICSSNVISPFTCSGRRRRRRRRKRLWIHPRPPNCPVSTLGPSAPLLSTRFCPGLILVAYVQEVVRQPVSQATSHVLTHLQAVFQLLGPLHGSACVLEWALSRCDTRGVGGFLPRRWFMGGEVGIVRDLQDVLVCMFGCVGLCLYVWIWGSFFYCAFPQTLRGGL